MKINSGVEWAAHACALLATLPPGWSLSAQALAAYHEVPPAYMAKQLQALSKAGIVKSNRGAKGGYTLTRAATLITLLDIFIAIEGNAPAFRCTEIRQKGPCPSSKKACKIPCIIAASFNEAETAYRDSIARVTILDVMTVAAQSSTPSKASAVGAWLTEHAAKL